MKNIDIDVDFLKEKYSLDSDEGLAEQLKVSIHTIRVWKQRGVPSKIQFYESQNTNASKEYANIIRIPKLSVTASAGGGNHLESIDDFKENGEMIIDSDTLKVTINKTCRAIKVSGYSMVPILFPDSWVVFDQSGEYKGEGLYVLNWDNMLMVKLLQLTPHGQMRIISTNKEYESYTINKNDESQLIFFIVGKVIRTII